MNLLQSFLDECNRQISDTTGSATPLLTEAFTFVDDTSGPGGQPVVYQGTFGDPILMPVQTRQGYQDYLVTPLKARAAQWTTAPSAENHKKLVRTATGRTFYVQSVDYTAVVVYTFICTDRAI